MSSPIITLTTDFGLQDSYVAQMKGAILRIQPAAVIVDLTHAIPPQDVRRGAFVLDGGVDPFPPGTIHVAVVDPGVGSARRLVAVEAGEQRFVGPDNGIFGVVAQRLQVARVVELTKSEYWRRSVSRTFHGRDILAPVAAHWSTGLDAAAFGPVSSLPVAVLPWNRPAREQDGCSGEILWADAFGNLVTNIPFDLITDLLEGTPQVTVGGTVLRGIRQCYADVAVGELVALIGSHGRLEIAVNHGSAAERLQAGVGERVCVIRGPAP